jgi:hypothetical protein
MIFLPLQLMLPKLQITRGQGTEGMLYMIAAKISLFAWVHILFESPLVYAIHTSHLQIFICLEFQPHLFSFSTSDPLQQSLSHIFPTFPHLLFIAPCYLALVIRCVYSLSLN